MNEPARYFFVHMQKTAGTALWIRLRREFGASAMYPTGEEEASRVDVVLNPDYLMERFEARKQEIRLVTGHFPLCVTESLGVPFSTFTLLRDPVERTLSFLRHHKKLDPGSRDLTLEEIYADPVLQHGLIRNHMVKMLSLTLDEMTNWAMTMVEFDDDHLEHAKANLADRVDVFGLQEHFDEFCSALAERYGWNLGEPTVANVTRAVPVSEEFRARIAEDNQMDVDLYNFALRLSQRRRHQTMGTWPSG